MAATFVNITEEILKVLVYYLLLNNDLCNYTKTIIRLINSGQTSLFGLYRKVFVHFFSHRPADFLSGAEAPSPPTAVKPKWTGKLEGFFATSSTTERGR